MISIEDDKTREREFRLTIERLETAADTPIVSGEMEHWLDVLDDALTQARSAIDENILQMHGPQLASIRREDQEMLQQVELMQREDTQIAEAVTAIRARVPVLKAMVERIEPDEKRAETAVADLCDQAVQLVARIRKQETALRTWLQEAFTRDRGVVD